MRRWPKPLRFLAKAIASVVVIAGIPVVGLNIGRGVYDMVTLEGCVKDLVQIEEDYKIAYQHIPPTGDPKVEAGYVVEIERTLEQRVAALWCPSSVQDEQSAFVEANESFTALMNTIAVNGIPQDQQGQALLWVQLKSAGDRAFEAQQTFEKALAEEYQVQRPQAAPAAPAS